MSTSSIRAPWGILLALAAGLYACRAGDGDRCVCGEDCREGLACVAGGRVLAEGECTPVVGDNADPGICVDQDEAAEDDGGDGPPEVFMDLGSKRDFDPGPPPDPDTETGTGTETGSDSSSGASTSTGGSGSSGSGSSGGASSGSTGSTGGGSSTGAGASTGT